MKEKEAPIRPSNLSPQANISLTLVDYNDIFSDFDRRDYSIRALSVDFLHESKRAAVDKHAGLELNLFMPEKLRDSKTEATIKTRLKEHFAKHFFILKKEKSQRAIKGAIMTAIGIALMLTAGVLLWKSLNTTTAGMFLLILLEPAGWFFFWEGLNILMFRPRDHRAELEFYGKMTKAKIKFISY